MHRNFSLSVLILSSIFISTSVEALPSPPRWVCQLGAWVKSVTGDAVGSPQRVAPKQSPQLIASPPNLPPLNLLPQYVGEENGKGLLAAAMGRAIYYNINQIRDSKVYLNNKMIRFSTGRAKTSWLNENELFVFDEQRNLIISRKEEYHYHSSLAQGKPVLCAGNIKIQDGIPVYLDNQSGHYHPTAWHLLSLVEEFYSQGIDLSKLKVKIFNTVDPNVQFTVKEKLLAIGVNEVSFS